LGTLVVALSADLGRIVDFPEVGEQGVEGDLGGVVGDLDDLGVTEIRVVFVFGVFAGAAGVAADDAGDTGKEFKGGFGAPETAAADDEGVGAGGRQEGCEGERGKREEGAG